MKYKLSICIPTLNRGSYIGETLESIVSQWEAGVEIVIVDGGSTDNTEQVVNSFQRNFPDIRYVKRDSSENKPSNEGFDRDCNHAVELAGGEYCWLMTDDDLLVPGAIRRVLKEVETKYAVIVVSVEIQNKDLSKTLIAKRPEMPEDRIYQQDEWNQFATNTLSHLTFVGAVIINRQLWLSRNREKYFGTGFIHVGVIFNEPIKGEILVIANSLVVLRYGNALWTKRAFQIWMFNWPQLIWSFPTIADEFKQRIVAKEPWRHPTELLLLRVFGAYSSTEYQSYLRQQTYTVSQRGLAKLIARLPRVPLCMAIYSYFYFKGRGVELVLYDLKNCLRNI